MQTLNPALQQSIANVNLPHIQAMIKELGKHGLAVTLPHIHNDRVAELPAGMMQVETDQVVSFAPTRNADPATEFPVSWRHNTTTDAIEVCAVCSFCK